MSMSQPYFACCHRQTVPYTTRKASWGWMQSRYRKFCICEPTGKKYLGYHVHVEEAHAWCRPGPTKIKSGVLLPDLYGIVLVSIAATLSTIKDVPLHHCAVLAPSASYLMLHGTECKILILHFPSSAARWWRVALNRGSDAGVTNPNATVMLNGYEPLTW